MSKYFRGIQGTAIQSMHAPLAESQLLAAVPSLFAADKHESRSARYTCIPTIDVLRGLQREGFEPFFAVQSRVRDQSKREFTKHMLRLRHRDMLGAGNPQANEIIIIVNSHDGASAYHMMAGVFRFVCQNGMIAGDIVENTKIRHAGDVVGQVIEGAYEVVRGFEVREWPSSLDPCRDRDRSGRQAESRALDDGRDAAQGSCLASLPFLAPFAAPSGAVMKRPSGFVLYEGPSVLDGQPIVCIATMRTANPKTGPMVQTWILRQDMSPVEAVKAGADASVWKAYKRGSYSRDWRPGTFRNLLVRLGAYGDPAAVPVEIWDSVLCCAGGWSGYTHQAGHPEFDRRILDWCMVSADTPMQAIRARANGSRTFRIKAPGQPLMAGEILCPATDEGSKTCATCGICSGARRLGPSVAIDVHGILAKRYNDMFAGARIPAEEVA